MDRNDKSKAAKNEGKANEKPATTETQKLSDSEVAIEILKKRAEELENNYKRALADYQNLEKRVAEERKEWIIKANKNLLLHILPILDTLILAQKHSKVVDQGLSLSVKQFLDILKNEGVIRIETMGKSFDLRTMECVETVEGEENKVIEETRAGFMLNDTVLIPVQVTVGKGK